jgi:hypothetical protein
VVLVIARGGGGGLVAGEEGATVSWLLEAQGTAPRLMWNEWPEMARRCAAMLPSVSA